MTRPHENAVLIAGPTASGKTSLALRIAEERGAVIVNADSMQVYGVLHRLTARPSASEETRAPHFLFGHVDPGAAHSTGAWYRELAALLGGPLAARPVVIVGGTGLYFRAAEGGLTDLPEVPAPFRLAWRQRLDEEGPEALHGRLHDVDPVLADRLAPKDGQRILRGLEMFEATGRPLSILQKEGRSDPLIDPATAERIVLTIDRDVLRQRIRARFRAMVEEGALDEVTELRRRGLADSLPAMRAIGVGELGAYLDGRLSLEEAIENAVTATSRYAKRQETWFRNQLDADWRRVDAQSL